jgi:DNA-binding GntR family transcriptional regulator
VLREEVCDRLIEDILTGSLPPGTRLIETRLARRFGISQAPVREALRDLALFGFVVTSPFHGSQVRDIPPGELLEIYPVRAALEGLAAREAAPRMVPATLARLDGLIGEMREAADRRDHRAHVEADFTFHESVVKSSGNRILEHVWHTMRLATTTFVTHAMITLTHRSLHEIAERHVPVLHVLRARDGAAAEIAMRRHIQEPGEWIRDAMARPVEPAAQEPERELGPAGV